MGPLKGFRIIELAGIGPALDCRSRGKRSIALNLKTDEGVEALLKLVETADALFEGFRPGVTEKLGIGPEPCMQRNPRLVYGRMTGWGQYGPLTRVAGHDINYISIGSIEPQFYDQLMDVAGLSREQFGEQLDKSRWPELKRSLEQVFRQKTRAQWCELMEGTDICFAPVLDIKEAQSHPHNQARKTYIDVDGMQQPAPAPRFSRTVPRNRFAARQYGADTAEVLGELGFQPGQLEAMHAEKVCG